MVTDCNRDDGEETPPMKTKVVLVVLLAAGISGAHAPVGGDGDWRAFGRDPGAQRYSPLTQITTNNIAALRQAWTFDTASFDLQGTPLVIDGMMYVAGGSSVFELEPETGRQIWKFEERGAVSRRGVAYWP